ncbi:alpha/beta fold hydrolase [Oceaniglobus roseus]|uniref:alpha/beta fold hydrolase n=1 Tax=Oceaniglobus roseus TaxID=1737570 RepID=UPI001FE6C4FF|nr:alpha/beta fold hydrolase [Kandeliimicrobium roseum]
MQAPFGRTLSVPRDGYTLHAEAIPPASDDARWLVFGNSLVTDLSIWAAQAAALAGRYGILRYDQAGHGQSGVPQAAVDFDDLGGDLLAVMDAAGLRRATYVGLSMGVPTGLAAHAQSADRFSALVLSDGQAKTAPGGAASWAERIDGARAAGMGAFAEETAGRWLTEGATAAQRAELTAMIAATPFEGFESCATALKGYDYAEELQRIACPVLLLAGAQDGAMPEGMVTKLKPAIAGAEMQVIDGAGHVPCFEQPAAFTAHLTRFLEGAA